MCSPSHLKTPEALAASDCQYCLKADSYSAGRETLRTSLAGVTPEPLTCLPFTCLIYSPPIHLSGLQMELIMVPIYSAIFKLILCLFENLFIWEVSCILLAKRGSESLTFFFFQCFLIILRSSCIFDLSSFCPRFHYGFHHRYHFPNALGRALISVSSSHVLLIWNVLCEAKQK